MVPNSERSCGPFAQMYETVLIPAFVRVHFRPFQRMTVVSVRDESQMSVADVPPTDDAPISGVLTVDHLLPFQCRIASPTAQTSFLDVPQTDSSISDVG